MYRNENVMNATNEFFFCFYKFHRRFRESPRNRDMHDDTYTYTFGRYFWIIFGIIKKKSKGISCHDKSQHYHM